MLFRSFQSGTLSRLKSSVLQKPVRICLMQMTIWAVWPFIGRILKKGGYSYRRFYRESMGYLRQSMEIAGRGELPC